MPYLSPSLQLEWHLISSFSYFKQVLCYKERLFSETISKLQRAATNKCPISRPAILNLLPIWLDLFEKAPSVGIRCNKVPPHMFQFRYIALRWKESKISANWQIWNLDVPGWPVLPILQECSWCWCCWQLGMICWQFCDSLAKARGQLDDFSKKIGPEFVKVVVNQPQQPWTVNVSRIEKVCPMATFSNYTATYAHEKR